MSDSLMTNDPASNPQGGNEGNENDWRAGLPEELRAEPSLATFKDVGSLAKSYVHAQKLRNERGLIPPKDEAPPEEWEQFYQSIGRPESPDKYEFGEVKLPDGFEVDADMEKAFREQAHKAGLTPKQAAALRDWYMQHANGMLEGQQTATKESREKAETVLRQEWGGRYDDNLARSQAALQQFLPTEDKEAVLEMLAAGPGNDPRFIKLFFNIAQAMTEDPLIGRRAMLNSQTAMEKALEITRHPAYIDANHPEHRQKVKEAQEMFAQAYPEENK